MFEIFFLRIDDTRTPKFFFANKYFFVLLKYNKGEKINVLIQKQYRLPEVVFLDLDRAILQTTSRLLAAIKKAYPIVGLNSMFGQGA